MDAQLIQFIRSMASSSGADNNRGADNSRGAAAKSKSKTSKTPSPITMYNEVSESDPICRSSGAKYDDIGDKKLHEIYASNLDIIHFVKDMFVPTKKYTRKEAKQFLKAYDHVIGIKKRQIWNMRSELLEATDPRAKTSRHGWKINYQIEQSIEELMRIEAEFKHLVRGANYLVS